MKYVLLIILSLFVQIGVDAQGTEYYVPTGSGSYTSASSLDNWYQNLEKYWYYRYKLVNDFMLIGPNAGMSIPVYRRDLKHWYNADVPGTGRISNCLDFSSDATEDLGHYIGMLALEYKQLSNNGFNTDRTLYELTYVQNALKRLTNNSGYYETGLALGTGGLSYYPGIGMSNPTLIPSPMSTDAMFLRDDCPYLTFTQPSYSLQNWKHFNRKGIAPLANPTSVLTLDEREVRKGSGAFDGHYFGYNPYDPTSPVISTSTGFNVPNCESQDQLQVIFDGEALVASLFTNPYSDTARDYITKLLHWLAHPTPTSSPGPVRPFFSIPDVLDPTQCAKHNCNGSGLFFFSAPPAAKAEYFFGNNTSLAYADMVIADNPSMSPSSTLAYIASSGFDCYGLLFEMEQFVTTTCTNTYNWYPLSLVSGLGYVADGVTYSDGYVAFASDWTIIGPPIPNPFHSFGIAATNTMLRMADVPNFLAANDPLSPYSMAWPINTSWSTLKLHAEGDLFGTPHYPLMWEITYGSHGWEGGTGGHIEPLLNSAPACGPYNYEASVGNTAMWGSGGNFMNHGDSAYANLDWSGNDRLDDPYHRQGNTCYDNMGYDCEFNGLDYMFLFGLYSYASTSSYLQGMMNPYYAVDYNVDYPVVSTGIGSSTLELKLNWLEYVSAINKVHATGTGGSGWLDYRGAKVIDLKTGFHAEQGSFFLAHIKDFNCNGGNVGDGPYHFAELNPLSTDLMPVYNGDSTHAGDTGITHAGFRPFQYIPNGKPYVPGKLPPANPIDDITDSIMNAPGVRDMYACYLKSKIINSITDTDLMAVVMQHFNWNDDTIAKYKIPVPDTVTISVFPNPTSGSSTLLYTLSKPSDVYIKFTNVIGVDFTYLIGRYDEQEEAGKHEVPIRSEQLTPGVYIVTMKAGPQTYSRKLSVTN